LGKGGDSSGFFFLSQQQQRSQQVESYGIFFLLLFPYSHQIVDPNHWCLSDLLGEEATAEFWRGLSSVAVYRIVAHMVSQPTHRTKLTS
jgi:hypothetical protein